ncbi:chromate transporter [Acidovorax sp. Leaf160]|uniref:chromate transporter n=1 Tax=Acidovorax sp. Leaf160 TaxID=1736280 RepID=UPI0009E8FCA3|nr:chromate transporter [Acidovorax sp. Leaf160]
MPSPNPPLAATAAPPLAEPPLAAPQSLSALFWAFTWLALQGFGGVLAVVQRELVEKRRWMTNEAFVEDWAVAQILPGPNVVNLAIMIGDRHFGLRGALVAVAGMLLMPLVLVLALALAYASFSTLPAVAGALRGMGAVAAGLVAGVGCKLAAPLARHPLGRWVCGALALATFVAMVVLRLPLAWILLIVGGAACVLSWRSLPPPTPRSAQP